MGGVVLTILNCVLVKYGAGRHIVTLTLHDIKMTIVLGFLCRVVYQFMLMTTKFAVCAFYLRIFQDRTSKIFIWVMIAATAGFTIPLFFGIMFRCNPVGGVFPQYILLVTKAYYISCVDATWP